MQIHKPATVSAIVGLLALAACAPVGVREVAAPEPPRPSPQAERTWLATDIAGYEILAGTRVTLRFDAKGNVVGSGGCNRYTAPYTLNQGLLAVTGPVVSTRMACAPAAMRQEATFLESLGKATVARESRPGVLNLSSGDTLLARFVAID